MFLMKADFEKGTKVCSKCKRELPISEFNKNKSEPDGLNVYCKICVSEKQKQYNDRTCNTFGRAGNKRGNGGMLVRDYELTKEQIERRNRLRKNRRYKTKKEYGVLVWYDGSLNNYTSNEYGRIMQLEYNRQRGCAIRGYVGRAKPSEHFLFDFDLEQMLKDNVYYTYCYCRRKYITKWWDGTIRHWTVNDGIWRKQKVHKGDGIVE